MKQKAILLVEDDENFGSLLKNYLELSGYSVTWSKNGAAGYSTFMSGKFDLCILDVMMPYMDGFTLAEKIKEKTKNIPIIFLTARKMKEDIIRGYKSGAHDYLNKPFDIEILMLKLDALFERTNLETEVVPESYAIGSYVYHSETRVLHHPAQEKKLSPKEGDLLGLLCSHINHVTPREKALTEIWGEESYFTKRSMDVYITKLRKYLAKDERVKIENVHSKGYGLYVAGE